MGLQITHDIRCSRVEVLVKNRLQFRCFWQICGVNACTNLEFLDEYI